MSAKWDRDWVRIGRYDRSRRRSTWARVVEVEGPPWLDETSNVAAIEMCSGREGDDAYVCIEPPHPAWDALLRVVLIALGNVDEPPDADECLPDDA